MLTLLKYFLKILNYMGNNKIDVWDNQLWGSLRSWKVITYDTDNLTGKYFFLKKTLVTFKFGMTIFPCIYLLPASLAVNSNLNS